ncbi:MAG: excalibur calcium-binding domain-containing protein [Pseudomonadota bacterium]
MSRLRPILAFLALSACAAPPPPPAPGPDVRVLSTAQLWQTHAQVGARDLRLVEAELGRRGQTRNGAQHLGQRSWSLVNFTIYSRRPALSQNRLNCSAFSSAAAAQLHFLAAGGPVIDPHGLDADGDGFACEWGTQILRIAGRSAAQPARTSRTCYTGPRGGTYTITASGRKDYGGC